MSEKPKGGEVSMNDLVIEIKTEDKGAMEMLQGLSSKRPRTQREGYDAIIIGDLIRKSNG